MFGYGNLSFIEELKKIADTCAVKPDVDFTDIYTDSEKQNLNQNITFKDLPKNSFKEVSEPTPVSIEIVKTKPVVIDGEEISLLPNEFRSSGNSEDKKPVKPLLEEPDTEEIISDIEPKMESFKADSTTDESIVTQHKQQVAENIKNKKDTDDVMEKIDQMFNKSVKWHSHDYTTPKHEIKEIKNFYTDRSIKVGW